MPLKRNLTREQELLGAHANYHASRQAPPPLAPRPARHSTCGPLPSFSNLVKDRPRLSLPELSTNTANTLFNNLKQYTIDGRSFVMASVAHESKSSFERVTSEGRRLTYHLEVVQAPARARACGNGPRSSADRRPVDPPPVVKLTIYHGNLDITASYQSNFMLFASLEFSRPVATGRGMLHTTHCPVLTGVCVAGAAYLAKPQAAAYFIFADLSVRHEGWYRLKFHLFEQNKRREDLDPEVTLPIASESTGGYDPPISAEQMVNRMHVSTTPFQVYSAKKFPGLQESTLISHQMAEQGIRVRIRREIRQRTDKNRKSGEKPDDEQRSIRAISHDRISSVDNYAHQPDNHRLSVDSSMPQSRIISRQQSYSHSLIASPSALTPSSNYPYSGFNNVEPATPQSAEPWPQSYNNSYSQAPAQVAPPPQQHRPSFPNLPSIASMINSVPASEPLRPQGGYYPVSSPPTKKRALNKAGDDSSTALKDRARPSLTPVSQTPKAPIWSSSGVAFGDSSKFPLASGEDIIEADDNDDDDTSDSSEDYILNTTHMYKRAAGGYGHVPRHAPRVG